MTCPKCGSGVADGATQCGICFHNLEQSGAQAASDAPLAFRMPVAPTIVQEDEPVAGIPGIDNMPKPLGGGAAPLPGVGAAPLPGAGSGQFKVSLTGEMIEVPSAMPTMSTRSMDGRSGPPSPSVGGNGAGALPPPVGIRPQVGAPPPPRSAASMPPRAGSSARRISPRPAADEYAGRKSGAGAIVAVIIVLLLAGGGAFGWFYWQKTHGPGAAVEKFLKAYQDKDWKTLYASIELPEQAKAFVTEDMFGKMLDAQSKYVKLTSYKVSDVTADATTATVRVTQTAEISPEAAKIVKGMPTGTKTGTESLKLKKVGDVWKLDFAAMQNMGGMGGLGGGGMAQGFGQ